MKYTDAKKLKQGMKIKRKVYADEVQSVWNPETYVIKDVVIEKKEVTIITITGRHLNHKQIDRIIKEERP